MKFKQKKNDLLKILVLMTVFCSFEMAPMAEAKRRAQRAKTSTPGRVTTPAEDFTSCEQESRRRIAAIEAEGKPKYTLIDFSKAEFKEEVAELPQHSGLPRRRRGAKHPPPPKPKPPLLGRRLIFQGSVSDSEQNQPVNVSCLVHLGKIITLVFELGDHDRVIERPPTKEEPMPQKSVTPETEIPL